LLHEFRVEVFVNGHFGLINWGEGRRIRMIELDLTKHGFGAMSHWIPLGFWWTVFVCVLVGMIAWALAWRGVRKSSKVKDLEIFIAISLTHLLFMPVFLWRDLKHARKSGAIYLSLFFVWCVGGALTQHHEQSKLEQFRADMKMQGEYAGPPNSEKTFNDSDTNNIWTHPVLLPLVIMGEDSERGGNLRRHPPFESWLPTGNFPIDSQFRASLGESVGKDLSHLYITAAGILHAQTPSFSLSMMPGTWREMMKRYGLMRMNTEASGDSSSTPPNFRLFRNGVYVGGEPTRDLEFAALKENGIKTLVSVDGATPKVEIARKYGVQYIHIPIGYDGIEIDQVLSLVRVAREISRPIYVHCHHGKHRGPAAAALICLDNGGMTLNQAVTSMERAGTSKEYAGLWESVSAFESPAEDAKLPKLVEIAPLGDLVSIMAKMDRVFDRLKESAIVDWEIPEDDPDLVPVQLAMLLREWFHELARNPQEGYGPLMLEELQQAERVALELENAFKNKNRDLMSSSLLQLEESCNQCHTSFRNH
jgi:protein tyrosine phosphatase (PTP) superfamily phosphohydrolase (DUF442 family)